MDSRLRRREFDYSRRRHAFRPPRMSTPTSMLRIACRCGLALALAFAPALHSSAADPAKTLRVALTSAEMSFDPQFSADAGSDGIIDHIYESMLDYDYLVRPVTLVPRTLETMPTVTDNGGTYLCRFRR